MTDYYTKVYEDLYQAGYRNSDVNNGAAFLKYLLWNFSFKWFLDVGCSTGKGVQTVAEKGIKAFGVDVSETAVRLARERGRDCRVGSIRQLNFEDKSFDMVFCSDVMEHLKPEDIDIALKELYRVSNKHIALVIALKKDKCIGRYKWFIKCKLPNERLHLSVLSDKQWITKIKDLNMNIIYKKVTVKKSSHLLIIVEKK